MDLYIWRLTWGPPLNLSFPFVICHLWMTACATSRGRAGGDCIVNEDKLRGIFSTQSCFLNILLTELPTVAWLLRGLTRQEFQGVLTVSINATHQFLATYWQESRPRYTHSDVTTSPSDFITSKVGIRCIVGSGQYSTVQYSTVQYSTVQYSTV